MKRIGYKTFKQMLRILKKANKSCEKNGFKAQYLIELPIYDPSRRVTRPTVKPDSTK